MSARYCPDCEEAVVTVKVAGKDLTLNAEPFFGVKLDQKPWARFLTARLVEVYGPHDQAECAAARDRRSAEEDRGVVAPDPPPLRSDPELMTFLEPERR